MTARRKFILKAFLFIGCFVCGAALGLLVEKRLCREAELELEIERTGHVRERALQRANELQKRLEMVSEQKAATLSQKAAWRKRESGEETGPPDDCKRCLQKVRREIEIEDETRGWWRYRDEDVLDEKPGEFNLTARFYHDMTKSFKRIPTGGERGEAGTESVLGETRGKLLMRPESSLRAGVGLRAYELEFGYSPVRLRAGKAELSFGVRSRLSLERRTSKLYGDLSAGVEVRW